MVNGSSLPPVQGRNLGLSSVLPQPLTCQHIMLDLPSGSVQTRPFVTTVTFLDYTTASSLDPLLSPLPTAPTTPCLFSTQQPEGICENVSPIMSLFCSNPPVHSHLTWSISQSSLCLLSSVHLPTSSLTCSSACLLPAGFASPIPSSPSRAHQVCSPPEALLCLECLSLISEAQLFTRMSPSQGGPRPQQPLYFPPRCPPALCLPTALRTWHVLTSLLCTVFPAGGCVAPGSTSHLCSALSASHVVAFAQPSLSGHNLYIDVRSGWARNLGSPVPFSSSQFPGYQTFFLLRSPSPALT